MSQYPSIFAVGHRYIADLFKGPVVVQEKIDGSQFNFGVVEGRLRAWSKRVEIDLDNPGMFAAGVETIRRAESQLVPSALYSGEYLAKPKHNTLSYSRVPQGNIVLFDIRREDGNYLGYSALDIEAGCLGVDIVPEFFSGIFDPVVGPPPLKDFLDRESFLGGCKIEGIVVKNYGQPSTVQPGGISIGKFVAPEFKERNKQKWSAEKQPRAEFIEGLIASLRTEARWAKAVQHLRDDGRLLGAPQDIPVIIREVQTDIAGEEASQIKDELFNYYWPQIMRGVIRGLPEYYKEKLAHELLP